MIAIQDFQMQTDAMLDLLVRLVEIESPSTDKTAVDRLGGMLAQELRGLGGQVEFDHQERAGDNVVARWNDRPGNAGLLVLCHLDTVYACGTLAQRPVKLERQGQGGTVVPGGTDVPGGRLYAPGALDMKGGIACFLTAIHRLQELGQMPNRPITALFTSDEEIGSTHSRALIERTALQAELVLCLEPALPDGSLKTARKGTGELVISTTGQAAHAGVDHARGRNAIEELAHHILAVQALTDYTTGTTLSVGKVEGGTRTNVVPDRARAVVDLRVPTAAEAVRIRQWASFVRPYLEGTSVTVTVHQDRPPMPRDALMSATFHKVQAIGTSLGLQFGEGSTGGGSDANYVAPLGIPVMDGLGPIGEGAHSEREYVQIDSLPERAALLAALLTGWK